MLITVAELPEYMRQAERFLSEAERREVIDYLASRPKAGVLIRATGGIRKLRWARGARGKSAGVRVIYYFHSERIPLYLLTMFGKNEQSDLSAAERNGLAALVKLLIEESGL
jgi:mRNA-degrading endonuclease RelE of RelBE toxin-antitoxin system